MKWALFLVVAALVLAGPALAQNCSTSTTDKKYAACLFSSEAASRSATDAILAKDNDALEKAMLDADAAIIVKLKELSARVTALEAGDPSPPGPEPVPVPLPAPAIFPNTDDGKPISQLGLEAWSYWNYAEPLIDLAKMNSGGFEAKGDCGRIMFPDLWRDGFIDKATGYPKSIPPNCDKISGGRYRHGALAIPPDYAGTYVATWDGDADVFLSWTQTKINANRVEATFGAADSSNTDWHITRIGPAGIRNLRIYRKSSEPLLAAGKLLDPRFKAHASRYKVLRFMDIQQASIGRPWHPGDMATEQHASWSPDPQADYAKAPDAPKHAPFSIIFRVAMEADAAAWVHVAGLPGAPTSFNSLIGGDPFLWRAACKTHMAAILASPEWAAYFDTLVSGMTAAEYPRSRMVYLEPFNEVWNWGGPWARMTHCAEGVSDWLGNTEWMGYRFGYGYLAGHVHDGFAAALKRAGREDQRWTLVAAGQAAWPATNTAALEGLKRFWKVMDAPTLKARMARVGVSVASYYGEGLSRTEGFIRAATDTEHLAALKAQIAAGTASKGLADWYLTATGPGRHLGNVIAWRREAQAIAESYGAFFVGDYEGESHENLPAYLAADPVVTRWNDAFIAGPEGERVTRAWGEMLRAQNPQAIISNYFSIAPRGDPPYRARDPWFDGYYGATTGRVKGLEPILRAQ